MLLAGTALSWRAGQGVGSVTAPGTVSAASDQRYESMTAGQSLVVDFRKGGCSCMSCQVGWEGCQMGWEGCQVGWEGVRGQGFTAQVSLPLTYDTPVYSQVRVSGWGQPCQAAGVTVRASGTPLRLCLQSARSQ